MCMCGLEACLRKQAANEEFSAIVNMFIFPFENNNSGHRSEKKSLWLQE